MMTDDPQTKTTTAVSEAKQQNDETALITVTGTIYFKPLEGGFYALDASDGRKFMPRGMDKDLLKNGMVVEVTGVILEDMLTFQQYGQVLKVKSAKMIDDSQVEKPNAF